MRLLFLLVVLSSVAMSGSCKSRENQWASNNSTCDGQSPSDFYINEEAGEDYADSDGENLGSLRDFLPDKTLKRFSLGELECWSIKQDPIADFLLAGKAMGSVNILELDDEPERFAKSSDIIKHLERASLPRHCANPEHDAVLFCTTGLPEAQYIIALIEKSTPNRQSFALYMLQEASNKGLLVASVKLSYLGPILTREISASGEN